jgi:hypothetical protein
MAAVYSAGMAKAAGTPTPLAKADVSSETSNLSDFADRLRSEGRLRLAEYADDAVWDAQVRQAAVTSPEGQDQLIDRLWSRVSKAYLKKQSTWLWAGESSGPRPIDIAVDAEYAANKAKLLVSSVLANDYAAGLLTKANTSTVAWNQADVSFDDPAAVRARIWINRIGTSVGASINGIEAAAPGRKSVLEQPSGAIVYAAACEPLVGTALGIDGAPKGAANQSCLLEPDQIETLARALLNRNLFADDAPSQDATRAIKMLTYITNHYPAYARMSQINSMLAGLKQAP